MRRNDSRSWTPPEIIVTGEDRRRSLSHLTAVLAMYTWNLELNALTITHGNWRTGDFHFDVFRYLSCHKLNRLKLHDITLTSGLILQQLCGARSLPRISLSQVRVDSASPPPSVLPRSNARSKCYDLLILDLDTCSLRVLADCVLAATSSPVLRLRLRRTGLVPPEKPALGLTHLLKATGLALQDLSLEIYGSIGDHFTSPSVVTRDSAELYYPAHHLSPIITHKLFAHTPSLISFDLTIYLDEPVFYHGWLLKVLCELPQHLKDLSVYFLIDKHKQGSPRCLPTPYTLASRPCCCYSPCIGISPSDANANANASDRHAIPRLRTAFVALDLILSHRRRHNLRRVYVGVVTCRATEEDQGVWLKTLGAGFQRMRDTSTW